jgi:UrcA family protein
MRSLLLMALPVCLAPALAHAGEAMVVRLGGLNLSTSAGATLAVQRMNDAAVMFCSPDAGSGPLTLDVTTLKCRRDMALRASRKLNHWNVTAWQAAGPTVLASAPSIIRRR